MVSETYIFFNKTISVFSTDFQQCLRKGHCVLQRRNVPVKPTDLWKKTLLGIMNKNGS
jgi:hypothetical protein